MALPISGGSPSGSAAVEPTSGTYVLSDLPAGEYVVRFEVSSDAHSGAVVAGLPPLVSEYFDNAADFDDARRVAVTAGRAVTDVNAVLGNAPTPPSEAPTDSPVAADSATPTPSTEAASPGSVESTLPQEPKSRAAEEARDARGTAIPDLSSQSEPGASISGRVSLPAGAPAEWWNAVNVSAIRMADGGFGGSGVIEPHSGEYTIVGLAAGDYRVSFSAGSYWNPETETSVQANLVSEYYEDTADYSKATPVSTSPDTPATGIDAVLESGASISGRVSLPAGSPTEWWSAVRVSASPIDGGGFGASAMVDPRTGEYTVTGLQADSYHVRFSVSSYWDPVAQTSVPMNLLSESYENAHDDLDAKPVSVSEGARRTGVDAILEPGATIRGGLRDTTGTAAVGVDVYWVDVDDPARSLRWGTRSDESGAYALDGLAAGNYKVLFGNLYESPAYSRVFLGGSTFESADTIGVSTGAQIVGRDAVVKLADASAARPGQPLISVSVGVDGDANVTWPAPGGATEPILAYSMYLATASWGGDIMQAGAASNETHVSADWGSTLVVISALSGSEEGRAAAVAINDPRSPTAPKIRASGQGNSLIVSAESSAPDGAQWWYTLVPEGSGVTGLRFADDDGKSVVFDDVDPDSKYRIYAGWRAGTSGSQIAVLDSSSSIPTVHPWFQAKYLELGGTSGTLGAPVKPMECQSASCWQQFEGGVLTSDGSAIVKLSTAYVTTWLSNGGPDGALGLVAGPESCFGHYCATPFTRGAIKWTPGVGVSAIPVHAWFQAEWTRLGRVAGQIGTPVRAMQCQSVSCWQEFEGGVLTSDGRRIVRLSTAYVSTWLSWGGPDGDLGLVASAEACFGSYCETPFTGGVIVWVPDRGVFPVAKNWFYNSWASRGGASGSLGLPTDAMRCQSSACYQAFEKGTLTSSVSGIEALSSAYVDVWLRSGGPDGPLGLLTGPEACFGTYCQVPFQHGLMVWQPGADVRILTGAELSAWLAATSAPSNPGDSKNCSDFSSRANAQAWFERFYPLYGDVARLDADNNGAACESLP